MSYSKNFIQKIHEAHSLDGWHIFTELLAGDVLTAVRATLTNERLLQKRRDCLAERRLLRDCRTQCCRKGTMAGNSVRTEVNRRNDCVPFVRAIL